MDAGYLHRPWNLSIPHVKFRNGDSVLRCEIPPGSRTIITCYRSFVLLAGLVDGTAVASYSAPMYLISSLPLHERYILPAPAYFVSFELPSVQILVRYLVSTCTRFPPYHSLLIVIIHKKESLITRFSVPNELEGRHNSMLCVK